MDFIAIIVGFCFIIKFLFGNRRDKLYQQDIDRRLGKIRSLKNDLENDELIYKYINNPVHYSDVRPLVHEAITRVCPDQSVLNSDIFGSYERSYLKYGNDERLRNNAENIALGLIMTKQGYLPVEWSITTFSGMYFANPNIGNGAQHNKEIYAIGKRVQQNLRACGKDVHVVIEMHKDLPNIISNTAMTLEEFNLSKSNLVRVDDISIDRVTRQ